MSLIRPSKFLLRYNYGAFLKALCLILFFALFLRSLQAAPIALFDSLSGNLNFTTGGGTLRTNPNSVDPCSVTTATVNAPVNNIPSGASIVKAYLYWSGSGSTPDTSVTFNGSTITASRTFTEQDVHDGLTFDFFQSYADITSFISGNGTYSFSGLSVDNTAHYCEYSQVHAGFALVVVYSHPSEDFRVFNIYDGLEKFWGSLVSISPSNFQIPVSPINGSFAVLSWDGDPDVDSSLNGISENITFNGTPLTDAANPINNQYNSTMNPYGPATTYYGSDWDNYDISSLLTAGQTSATSVYSSGGDFVLLGAQVFINTNTTVSDLAIDKSHSGDFPVNVDSDYTLSISNNGPYPTVGTTTVIDTLPAGMSFVSASGTGWNCSFSAPNVTCTSSEIVASGSSFQSITLTVNPGNTTFPSIDNQASVSGSNFDIISANDQDTDTTTITGNDFTNSTLTVVDLNGGEVDAGDVLRFTITLENTSNSNAVSVSVTDHMPLLTESLSVVSIPSGATDSSTGAGTGNNSTGFLDIGNVNVSANSSEEIIFEVTVSSSANPGDNINNSANIDTSAGIDGAPSAPTLTVSPSQLSSSGTKQLYVQHSSGILNRTVNSSTSNIDLVESANNTYALTPALQSSMELAAGNILVTARMRKRGSNVSERTVEMSLDYVGSSSGSLGSHNKVITFNGGNWQTEVFSINLASNLTLSAGTQIRLTVRNNSTGSGNRNIRLRELRDGVNFHVALNSNTVINVDSVENYSAAYSGGSVQPSFDALETNYIRAVVSDPFGSYDISSASISIFDPSGASVLADAAMIEVADSGALTKTYEYSYPIPGGASPGQWSYRVTANEGTENTIDHTRGGSFIVNGAGAVDIKVLKSSAVLSDPVRGSSQQLRIPGSVIQYTITTSNEGDASPDANSVSVSDVIPSNSSLCVQSTCASGGTPVTFVDGSPSSALSFNYSTDVAFSNQVGGGAPFNYTPAPDSSGYDSSVTGLRVEPSGTFSSSSGSAPHPSFQLRFIIKID